MLMARHPPVRGEGDIHFRMTAVYFKGEQTNLREGQARV